MRVNNGAPAIPRSTSAALDASVSDRQLLNAYSWTPFVDSTELALILGEPHTTVHRALTDLLAEGIVGRVSHGTVHLASSQRYYLTAARRRSRLDAWLCGPIGLRASLSHVQRVADAAHPPDGCSCQRLPTRRLAVPPASKDSAPGCSSTAG
ncbi:MAG: hypothetical protein OXD46_09030 [Chloroflexi bacterium]|nr:hypothetical protein [Chloroflexota bacterium]